MGNPLVIALLAAFAINVLSARTDRVEQAQPDPAGSIAIIVAQSNPVDGLSLAEVRRIFLLETQTWPHGRKITLVLREKGQPERAEVIQQICEMSEAEYDRHVLFQTFRGTVAAGPRAIRSAEAMLRFIFNAPGAIGHVHSNELNSSVKALRIDGFSPGDARYPLRLTRPRPDREIERP